MRFTDRSIAGLKAKGERYEEWEDGHTGLGVRVGTGLASSNYGKRSNATGRQPSAYGYKQTNSLGLGSSASA